MQALESLLQRARGLNRAVQVIQRIVRPQEVERGVELRALTLAVATVGEDALAAVLPERMQLAAGFRVVGEDPCISKEHGVC